MKGAIGSGVHSRIMSVGAVRRHSAIAFLATVLITGIGFVSTMLFAHLLGPVVMGGYFLFLAYYGIVELFGDGGIGGAAVKRMSEGREQEEYFTAFLVLRVTLFLILVSVIYLARDAFIDLNEEGLLVPLFCALSAGLLFSIGYNTALGTGRVGISKIGEIVNYLVKVAVQIGAVLLGFGLGGLVGGVIAGLLAGSLLFWRYARLRLKRFNFRHVSSLAIFSFWIFLTASGNIIFSYTDVIVIGYFLGNAEVGIYRVAYQLTSAATFTAVALQVSLFPKISRWAADGDFGSVEGTLKRAFSYALFLALPVSIGGTLLGDRLLYYLYGAAFIEGAAFLPLLLLSQVVNVCLLLLSMGLSALNRPDFTFRATAIAAALNLLLNIAFIPPFGMSGAAVATLLSISLNALLSYRFLSGIVRVQFDTVAVRNILISGAVMIFPVVMIRYGIPDAGAVLTLSTVAIGAAIYLLILFRLDREIKQDLLKIFRELGLPIPLFIERF